MKGTTDFVLLDPFPEINLLSGKGFDSLRVRRTAPNFSFSIGASRETPTYRHFYPEPNGEIPVLLTTSSLNIRERTCIFLTYLITSFTNKNLFLLQTQDTKV